MSMATKLGRVGTYNEEFPFIKLHDPPIIRSCGVILYFHLYYTNEQQTWKGGELL